MKFAFSIVFLTLIIYSCGNTSTVGNQDGNESTEVNSEMINKVVSQAEFKALLKTGDVQLIDVRTPEEYNEGYIPNALNIDFYSEDFKAQLEKLDKNKPVLVYCRSGNRSGQASELLNELGFKEVYDLEGGYSQWEK